MTELFYKAAGAVLAPFRYAEREVQHMKEVAKEDIQALLANAIKWAAIGIVGLFFLFFLSITAAAAINESTDSLFLGYAVVAGFYLLTATGLYLWKVMTEKEKEKEKKKKEIASNSISNGKATGQTRRPVTA